MRSPMSELVRSPPASTTITSPFTARLSAMCTIRLSPGAVRTVSAGPAIAPPAWYGRRRAPPALMRNIESLILATGILRNLSTHAASTVRRRLRTLKPAGISPPPGFRYAGVCMILAALLTASARAEPLPGAEKVGFADMFGWWLPVAGAGPRPAAIALHACEALSARSELNARERAMVELLRDRGYHV